MSYQKITSFAVKDTMADNNPLKVVRGKEFDDEFAAITTAMDAQELVIANLVTTPAGGIIMYGAAVAPAGFLLCDGAARSRSTYTALFQAIGTTFGAGDGATTFNLPNFNSRFPSGMALGQVGGSADSSLPSHTHGVTVSVSDPGHAHNVTQQGGRSGGAYQNGPNPDFRGESSAVLTTTTSATGIGVSASIAATGVLPTNTNLPPFLGVTFIIKI